MNYQSKANIA